MTDVVTVRLANEQLRQSSPQSRARDIEVTSVLTRSTVVER
jgi:hypothetical protein